MPEIECGLPYPHDPHVWYVTPSRFKITTNGVVNEHDAYCFGDGNQ